MVNTRTMTKIVYASNFYNQYSETDHRNAFVASYSEFEYESID
jgi:hypothetical protein